MNKNNKLLNAFIKQFLIIFLYIFITLVLQMLFINYLDSNNNFLKGFAYYFVEFIILIVFIIIYRKLLFKDIKDFKKNGKLYIDKNFKYYIFGLIAMIISNFIISSFIPLPTNELKNRTIFNNLPIYSLISCVICAPIIEELMLRVPLKDAFKHNFLYYFISSFIFGSLHLLSASSLVELLYIIPYSALGFSLAVIYQKSNNVYTNMFYHGLHNLISLTLIFLGGTI